MSENYFAKLNYSLANEDARIETEVLPEGSQHVAVVAGSGSRVLPLLSKGPKRISIVDICEPQLFLSEMRIAALRALDHGDFLKLLGYEESCPKERESLFHQLDMSVKAKAYLTQLFQQHNWNSILYEGRWEKLLLVLHRAVRLFIGKKMLAKVFDHDNLEDQKAFFKDEFPMKRWYTAVFLLGNSAFFNSILYKGSFPKKNIPFTFYGFYHEAYQRLFFQHYARENFYLNLLLLGKIAYPQARPIEADPKIFAAAKEKLHKIKVDYYNGSMIDLVKEAEDKVDFVSFSNVPSYFKPPEEQDYLQMMAPNLALGALVVSRAYMRIPFRLDSRSYELVSSKYQKIINKEQTQMYYIDVYQHRSESES